MESFLALIQCFNPEKCIEEDCFNQISIKLLSEYQIQSVADGNYAIEEIEFYFFNQHHQDTSTHRHGMDAGQWRVHYSGIDITFQGCEKYNEKCKWTKCIECNNLSKISYGGILIRSISKGDEVLSGPLRVQTTLLSGGDIAGSRGLQLIKSNNRQIKPKAIQRVGINHPEEYKDRYYGFYNAENIKLEALITKRKN